MYCCWPESYRNLWECEACSETVRALWISREPVLWPSCNLAASQRRPYCASVNIHSPVRLGSRQWDAIDWACVLCDRRIHSDRASSLNNAPAHSAALVQAFLAKHHITQVCQPPYFQDLAPWDFLLFPKLKSPWKWCDGHIVHKLSQRRLTAYWLAPRECDCSRMGSKVSSDWMPSYTKATQPVLEILKMDGYSPDSPRTNCPFRRWMTFKNKIINR